MLKQSEWDLPGQHQRGLGAGTATTIVNQKTQGFETLIRLASSTGLAVMSYTLHRSRVEKDAPLENMNLSTIVCVDNAEEFSSNFQDERIATTPMIWLSWDSCVSQLFSPSLWTPMLRFNECHAIATTKQSGEGGRQVKKSILGLLTSPRSDGSEGSSIISFVKGLKRNNWYWSRVVMSKTQP
ncbi:putative Aquaporin NIP1.1 [Corchorus olitorius]|uniref:Aquaporin NIP1.1 n=1 Tax=Corchorus olitorius TaxID=93759 RepID=A0A1R3G359_9ROSI|nr:putative Aquaporin NIP1.1 [Corchorus olitorius]